jgi:TatD DNase family protein
MYVSLHTLLITNQPPTHRIEAMSHPRCVGWGEMGLDYHYDLSPRDTQRSVFRRQLIHAVRLGKPLTIHTREAENDTEAILKELVPKDHPVRSTFSNLCSVSVLTQSHRSISTVSQTHPNSHKTSSTTSQTSTSE